MSFHPQMHGEPLPPRSSRSKSAKKNSSSHLYLLITFALLIVGGAVYWWLGQDRTAFTTESTKEMAGSSQPSLATANQDGSADAEQAAEVEIATEAEPDLKQATEVEPSVEAEPIAETEEEAEEEAEVTTDTEQTDGSSAGKIAVLTHHRVLPGETLYSITMKYYGSRKYMDELAAYNGIRNNSNIRTGTVLKIPDLNP